MTKKRAYATGLGGGAAAGRGPGGASQSEPERAAACFSSCPKAPRLPPE